MFNIITGRILAGAAVAAFLAGATLGWTVNGWRLDNQVTLVQLAEERLRNAALEDNLRRIRETLIADGKSELKDLQTMEEIDALTAEVVKAATDKPAFSAATVDSLRSLFDKR